MGLSTTENRKSSTMLTIITKYLNCCLTKRLNLNRSQDYNNNDYSRKFYNHQINRKDENLPSLANGSATSQQQQQQSHHIQQQQFNYRHNNSPHQKQHQQQQKHFKHYQQHRKLSTNFSCIFLIALLGLSFLTTTLPAINATKILQHQQQQHYNYQQQIPRPTQHQEQNYRDLENSLEVLTRTRIKRSESDVKLARNETTCKTTDIRNNASEFKRLANCTIIEGFLLISLINDASKINESYPLLTEVTEYIIIYRVHNLLSLSQIFPNLSVIRGNALFDGYALIVYQNRDLEDIGLSKLKAIANGGVRIERNLSLCFVKTVDWSRIVSRNATESDIVLKMNRNEMECPKCPGELKGGEDTDKEKTELGPICKEYPGHKRYCWNNRACQTICPDKCRNNCIDENTCCEPACLGGCSIDAQGQQGCTSCRNFSIHNYMCVDNCPKDYFKYDRRCITAAMCESMGTKFESNKQVPLVHFRDQCTARCPKGYNMENSTCVECGNKCEKPCEGGIIDSFVRAKEFQGCTKIGDKEGLTISIKRGGPHMKDALEAGLGAVHTINTYLKVHLTYGLFSLDFFKSLREIKGQNPSEGRYALYVLENNDLEAIWAPNQTVNITNGSVFFHFNPKLCYNTIDALRPMMANNPAKFNKTDVATDSNGNKGSCDSVKLNVTVRGVTHQIAVVDVSDSMKFADERAFIGYQYYVMEDPYRNATKQSYKPCEDNWIVSDPIKDLTYVFGNLLPFTQYAFYVRTMTISSEPLNGQSDISYFTTKPAQPEPVRRINARSINDSEIILTWDPPRNIYGKLVKYMVRAELTHSAAKTEQQRNYCQDPLRETFETEDTMPAVTEKTPLDPNCNCNEGSRKGGFDPQSVEPDRQDEIEFENTLQNFLYVRGPGKRSEPPPNPALKASMDANIAENSISDEGSDNALRRRRRRYVELEDEMDEMGSVLLRHIRATEDGDVIKPIQLNWPNESANNDTDSWLNDTKIASTGDYYEVIVSNVMPNETTFVFRNLRHFTLYTLWVVACRERDPIKDAQPICSNPTPVDKLTKKRSYADLIPEFDAQLENTNTTRANVRLKWLPPKQPNGAIVSYTIEYKSDAVDADVEKKCIDELGFQNLTNGYVLPNLNEGNYSIRVRANSLAGEGIFTKYVYVNVPPPGISGFVIFGIVAAVVVILGLLIAIFTMYSLRKKATPLDLIMNTTVNPFYVSLQYVPDDWEVPRDLIIQLRPLGQGSFGMVYEGILKGHQNSGEDTPCAIKTVNENATDRERTNFLNEASVMKEFDTYHVVRLLGVCSRGQPALVVMELMKNGDLKSYLRAHRPDERDDDVLAGYQQRIGVTAGNVQPPPYSRIYQMAIEIADGMAYLAAKKFVHRDLAARNCMVAHDLTVKIGDFGMTRDIYETDYYRKGTKGLLPVRWMPPESLRDGVYASSSDVFSYGVVLWEMATLASQPYQGLSNEQVLRYVIDGGVMERPENCPDLLYTLMQRCWHHRPLARPSFLDIIAYLEHLADPHFKEVAFYYSEAGLQYREKENKEKGQQGVGGEVYNEAEGDTEDPTTPLRANEYPGGGGAGGGYKSSTDQPAESPIVIGGAAEAADQPHSPFSMHSGGYIVSSTPDGQSNLSHTNPTLMSSAPSTSAGVGAAGGGINQLQQVPRPYYGRTTTISQGDDADASAYVLPDTDTTTLAAGGESQGTDERGYELYDPSPNLNEMDDLPSSGLGGGKLSGEQHLLPRIKRGGPVSIMPMSSSMPEDGMGGVASSLQPSTVSAASSNASSNLGGSTAASTASRYGHGLKRVADAVRNRAGLLNRHFNNHKRSGSNASHKSTGSNPMSTSSNTNLTSSGAGRSVSGQNLGTIESGGSGSAGSYAGTPRFYTPTATPSAVVGTISDNPNYKQLDDLAKPSTNSNYKLLDETATAPTAGPTLTTTSLNPNYEMMQPQPEGAASLTTSSLNPNYQAMQPPGVAAAAATSTDNPNYVLMSEPQARAAETAANTPRHISDNPNYAMMGVGGGEGKVSSTPPAELYGGSSASSEYESDLDLDDMPKQSIKMERMPLSRQKPKGQRSKHRSQSQSRSRSRSASQTRQSQSSPGNTIEAQASSSTASNILKENWLRQSATPRPPPPNGFAPVFKRQ